MTKTLNEALQVVWPPSRTGGVMLGVINDAGVLYVAARPCPCDILEDEIDTGPGWYRVKVKSDDINGVERAAAEAVRGWHRSYRWCGR